MNLKDKVFLVTGGSSGIGKATAQLLVERGAKVAITGRDGEKLQRVADELGVHGIHADVGSQADIDKTFAELNNTFGGLHGLINNAGIGKMEKIEDLTWENYEETFRVNVFGAAMMAKGAAAVFREQQSGVIVNIASTASLKGFPGGSVYSASKFALRSMSQCWQMELRKDNIRVVHVNPSEVTTAFADPERQERAEQPNKLRPLEIAHAIVTAIEMDDRGYIPEVTIHATNPF